MNRHLATILALTPVLACAELPQNQTQPSFITCAEGESCPSISTCTDDDQCLDGDYCNSQGTCITPSCGNGVTEAGEACDDGNGQNNDGCDNDCSPSVVTSTSFCGDGITDPGEECDDANINDHDSCLSNCIAARCGDGLEQFGVEECDLGAGNSDDGACLEDCRQATCGDGFRHVGVEFCDDGNDNDDDACRNNCTAPTCGNGEVEFGELCDDGDLINGDGCDSNCTPTGCPNGITTVTEECDDGNMNNNDLCTNTCEEAGCGDGFTQAGEECDDENTINGDGCDNNCTLSVCGNTIVAGAEECEPGVTALAANQLCVGCAFKCAQGYADCDGNPINGCERNIDNDAAHCGACGYGCGGGSCTAGTCEPFEILAGPSIWSTTVDDTHIYYGDLNGVHRKLKDGTGSTQTISSESNVEIPEIRTTNSHVYYYAKLSETCTTSAQCTGGGTCDPSGNCINNNVVRRRNKDGSAFTQTPISGVDELSFQVEPVSGAIYYTESTGGTRSFNGVIPGVVSGTLASYPSGTEPLDVKMTDTHVYWRTNTGLDRTLYSLPFDLSFPIAAVLTTTVNSPEDFTYDLLPGFVAHTNESVFLTTSSGQSTVVILPYVPGTGPKYTSVAFPVTRTVILTDTLEAQVLVSENPYVASTFYQSPSILDFTTGAEAGFLYFREQVTTAVQKIVKIRAPAPPAP